MTETSLIEETLAEAGLQTSTAPAELSGIKTFDRATDTPVEIVKIYHQKEYKRWDKMLFFFGLENEPSVSVVSLRLTTAKRLLDRGVEPKINKKWFWQCRTAQASYQDMTEIRRMRPL